MAKLSSYPSAVALSGTELVPIVVPGSPDVNQNATTAQIAALGGGSSGSGGSGSAPSTCTVVQTAVSPNTTGASVTATFASPPAVGNLILGFLSANAEGGVSAISGPRDLSVMDCAYNTSGTMDDTGFFFVGIGDGVTASFTFAGPNSNGTNVVLFEIAGARNYEYKTSYVKNVPTSGSLPVHPMYAGIDALVFYAIPFDNTPATLAVPTGWTAVFVGGGHGIGVAYRTMSASGWVQPVITPTSYPTSMFNVIACVVS